MTSISILVCLCDKWKGSRQNNKVNGKPWEMFPTSVDRTPWSQVVKKTNMCPLPYCCNSKPSAWGFGGMRLRQVHRKISLILKGRWVTGSRGDCFFIENFNFTLDFFHFWYKFLSAFDCSCPEFQWYEKCWLKDLYYISTNNKGNKRVTSKEILGNTIGTVGIV